MARISPNMSETPSLLHTDARTTQQVAGLVAAEDRSLLAECVELFNHHYGHWGPLGLRPGSSIRITAEHLADLLRHPEASLSCIRQEGQLAGYCAVVRFDVPDRGNVHWVSQLVVARQYRNMRLATDLLFAAWHFSGAYAWGLATVNPYAVRALETTTRRHCQGKLIVQRGDEMCRVLNALVPYIPPELVRGDDGNPLPSVDTAFFVDHADIERMKENAGRVRRRWSLGKSLPEGHEWLAVVFGEQSPADIDADRLEHLLSASDESWKSAYSRMALDENHTWMNHTDAEVELLLPYVPSGGSAVDIGCGVGRHAAELAERAGCEVLGIDIVPSMIDRAKAQPGDERVAFRVGDLRTERGTESADLVYALYDVLGSSTRTGDDAHLLASMKSFAKPGGTIVLSVMNAAPTLADARLARASDESDLVRLLEALPPSNAMEQTGSVFDPARCLEYRGVFFRKEVFTAPGATLPAEIIVRDRRFNAPEIVVLVEAAGLELISVTPVQTGFWSREPALPAEDPRAKELLVVARRRSEATPEER